MKCIYAVIASEKYDSNMFYFTGFKGYGILIIPKKGKPTLIASVLDVGNVENKKISLNKKISNLPDKKIVLAFEMNYPTIIKSIESFNKTDHIKMVKSRIRELE